MDVPTRYVLTLPGQPGSHRPQEAVTVHATGETSESGRPVFADGELRVEIADGIAHVLATPTGATGHTCLPATPCSDGGGRHPAGERTEVLYRRRQS